MLEPPLVCLPSTPCTLPETANNCVAAASFAAAAAAAAAAAVGVVLLQWRLLMLQLL